MCLFIVRLFDWMTHIVTKTDFVVTDKDLLKYKDPEKRKKYKRELMWEYTKKWRHNHPDAQHKRERRHYANLKDVGFVMHSIMFKRFVE